MFLRQSFKYLFQDPLHPLPANCDIYNWNMIPLWLFYTSESQRMRLEMGKGTVEEREMQKGKLGADATFTVKGLVPREWVSIELPLLQMTLIFMSFNIIWAVVGFLKCSESNLSFL